MISIRSNPLVGEGCPALDVEKAAKKRNSNGISLAGSCSVRPERVENSRNDQHTVGTVDGVVVPSSFASARTH